MGQVYEAICTRRTVRRYEQKSIPESTLLNLINAARLAPSGANIQPCEFIVVNDPEWTEKLYPTLQWAGYLAPEGNPPEGEHPVAYIVVLVDLSKKKKKGDVDGAACIQNILLAAWEDKIGTCWLGSIDRKKIKKMFRIPHYMAVDSVVALGYSKEKPIAVDFQGSVKYWKDKEGVLHVPKRKLEDIVHKNGFGSPKGFEE